MKPTLEMKDEVNWLLSVFHDNSGVIAWDDEWSMCMKAETPQTRPYTEKKYLHYLRFVFGVGFFLGPLLMECSLAAFSHFGSRVGMPLCQTEPPQMSPSTEKK